MEQRNLIMAVVASVTILLGWQFLYEQPRVEKEMAARKAAQIEATKNKPVAVPGQKPATSNGQGPTVPSPTPQTMVPSVPGSAAQIPTAPVVGVPVKPSGPSRASILQKAPRVQISSDRLTGSIQLKGGQIDDLVITNYRKTLDASSPAITLLSPTGTKNPYYAQFGWVAGNSSVKLPTTETVWTADRTTLSPKQPLKLSWDNGQGLKFNRTITLDENYMFSVTQVVENNSRKTITLYPYGLVSRTGTPETLGFFILHEGLLGVFNGQLKEVDYDDVQDAKTISQRSKGGWIGITDKYWLTALIPDQKADTQTNFRHNLQLKKDKYQVDYLGDPKVIPAGSSGYVSNQLFAGAKEVKVLDSYEEDLGISRFDLAIDFGWFYFLTKPIFYVLLWFADHIGNFGLAILLLTVLIKLVFFPLANKSYRAMSRLKQLQPKMTKLRDRHKDDKAKMNEAMMKLYKTEKVNPAAGCFPMLVQIPVFFALYKVLFVSIEMRHAPFYGWIQDLSAPDPTSLFTLFGVIPWTPPEFLMIGIWPILMGITMFMQQKLNPAPADPMQAKIFMFLPLMFTFMLARFPAGLVIYWAWNNILSIAQQWVIMRRMGVKVNP
jgi:YidC/Oxa1 family membrane protein insertase